MWGLYLFVFYLGLLLLVWVYQMSISWMAKSFGMRVLEISIGFPPTLFRRKIGEIEYRFGLIPIGGYSKIQGMLGEVDGAEPQPHEFRAKPLWQRCLVMLAGPLSTLTLSILGISVVEQINVNQLLFALATTVGFIGVLFVLTRLRKHTTVVISPIPIMNQGGAILAIGIYLLLFYGLWVGLSSAMDLYPLIPSDVSNVAYLKSVIQGNGFWNFFFGFFAYFGLLNLLPIPSLIGGHLAYLLFEGITRYPIPDASKKKLQIFGAILMYAFYIWLIYAVFFS